jgi:hypothetical protein
LRLSCGQAKTNDKEKSSLFTIKRIVDGEKLLLDYARRFSAQNNAQDTDDGYRNATHAAPRRTMRPVLAQTHDPVTQMSNASVRFGRLKRIDDSTQTRNAVSAGNVSTYMHINICHRRRSAIVVDDENKTNEQKYTCVANIVKRKSIAVQ